MTVSRGHAPGAPVMARPSWAKTPHDALPLPGGRTVGEAPNDELRRILSAAGVPGVSAENGRAANVGAYAEHVERVKAAGANRAFADWLATKAGEG